MEPITSEPLISPEKECDIVMKGGITSGVVYPRAVCELAREYRLRSIGGTSAGAIAAGLTAAAELRRQRGSAEGFLALSKLPGFLQESLTSLFQPAPATRPLFEVLLTWLQPAGVLSKVARTIGKVLRFHAPAFLGGTLAGALLFLLLVAAPSAGLRPVPAVLVLLLFAGAGGLVLAVVSGLVSGIRAIEATSYGLCPGLGTDEKHPALTTWLADTLDQIAGKRADEGPLTFGDLWKGTTQDDPALAEDEPSKRAVDLQVMTTNLTHGVPERLPFKSRLFFFDPEELRKIFPERIVCWMEKNPRSPAAPHGKSDLKIPANLRRLPDPAHLPVVVAARMSLSFPILISAVPLYAVDRAWNPVTNAWDAWFARCWFSDGGIGSNFPVHFFDHLVPSRPTFGINLRPFPPGRKENASDQSQNVWFPTKSGQGVTPTFTEIKGLFSFLVTILDTMQNWVDNTQMRLPGYRDRVVHVHLTDKEGGMNLTMPANVIKALTERGSAAGRKLATEFDWDSHRWTRYRTAMDQLRDKLGSMDRVYQKGLFSFLESRSFNAAPHAMYGSKEALLDLTNRLMEVGSDLQEQGKLFSTDPPAPVPDLRIMPQR